MKLKTLLAAFAAMVSLGAHAGAGWTAPEAPAASDPVSGQTYKIRNVSTGRYLSGGAAWFSWATSAILADVNSALEWTISGAEATGYTLACNRDGNNKLFTSGNDNAEQCMHVDGGSATTYFFEKQGSGYYRLRQDGVTGKYVGGPDGSNGVLAQVDPANPSVNTITCDWEFVPLSALTTYAPTISYAEMRASVLGFIDMTDIYTDANDAVATLQAGVYAQDDVVDAATTAEEVNNATAAIKALILPFISSVTIKDGKSFDITSFITNPSFESAFTGWTNTGMATQGNNSFGGKVGSTYAEAWQPNGTKSVSQALTGLPEGYYTLSANILARTVTSAKLYAGDSEVYATIADASNPYSLVFNCADNANVTIGFEAVGTGAGASWIAVDNFGLTYLGKAPLVLFQNELADAVTAARAHATALSSTIPAAALTAYNNAIDAAEAANTTIDACQASIAAIESATATADGLVAPYAAYQAQVANATFAGVASATIEEQNTAVAAATNVAAINSATAALRAAIDALAFDITSFTITNAAAQSKTGWEGTDFGGQSDGVTEYWNAQGAGFRQTIHLPAGKYCMTVVALQRLNRTGIVYAGEETTTIAQVGNPPVNSRSQAATWFAAGNGRNYVNFTLADEADVTIGLTADATTADYWTVWQSFKLETFTESVAVGYLAPSYAEAVTEAQTIHDNATYTNVTGSEKTALETAIDASPSTVAEYEAALTALNAATTAFTAAAPSYDRFVAEQAIAHEISETITETYPTSADDALTKFQSLKIAEYNFVATAYPYSATSKIGEFSTWTRTGTVNGAEKNQFEALTSQHWSGTAMTYYEQPATGWDNSAWTANYTKITTLPAGDYVIKVAARAASGNGTTAKITCTAAALDGPIFNFGDTGKGITTAGVASFDEGTFCNSGNGRGWVWNYLPFTLNEETTVTMTVVAEATGTHQWFSVCDGELLSKTNIATPVAYNEAEDNTIEDVDVANVTITRAIKEGYNTVVLPFDLTASQVQTVFGTGTKVYAYSEDSADPNDATINFNTVVAGTISANVPVLVKATAASTEQVFEGVQIVAPSGDAKVAGTNFDFFGTYAAGDIAAGDFYIATSNEGSKIYKSQGDVTIKAFRAYFDDKSNNGGNVKMFIDDVETSINSIMDVPAANAPIYTLAGQRVSKAVKGLYIVNGKKVVIK